MWCAVHSDWSTAVWTTCPELLCNHALTGSWTHDLLIKSLMPKPLCHHATLWTACTSENDWSKKDTDLSHCNKPHILLAEFMENATISPTEDQHCFICVILMSNATQSLCVYQITFTQHCKQYNTIFQYFQHAATANIILQAICNNYNISQTFKKFIYL